MITESQAMKHFQHVFESTNKPENHACNSLTVRLAGIDIDEPSAIIKRIREYSKIESIEYPDSTDATQKLNSFLDFLNDDNTLETIKTLSSDEKSDLIQILFMNSTRVNSKLILTESCKYLAAQPTSDQYLVGLIGSLMDFALEVNKTQPEHNSLFYFFARVHDFKDNKASHLPETFVNGLARIKKSCVNQAHYGLNGDKATKNISKPCETCLIQQTNQKEHNKIFHPADLQTLSINEPNTKLIYSEKLLNLIKTASYTDQEKERLLPPVLFRMFWKEAINFSALLSMRVN